MRICKRKLFKALCDFALGIVTPWGGDLLARLRFRRLVVSEVKTTVPKI